MQKVFFFLLLYLTFIQCAIHPAFVDISDLDPSIIVEMRYSREHNFMGKIIDGYHIDKDVCLLTAQAAKNLVKVNQELKMQNQTLKVYDCYRPQRAIEEMLKWIQTEDTKMKNEFYPTKNKMQLINEGFIESQSSHSRGSSVDLTIVNLPPKIQPPYEQDVTPLVPCFSSERFEDNSIDMGTGYDCFHELSQTNSSSLTPQQYANRMKLVELMKKYNFTNYGKEWWHFTLDDEPFPSTYFNFVIRKFHSLNTDDTISKIRISGL